MALDPVTASLLQLRDSHFQRMQRYQLNWLYYRANEYLDELGKQYTKEQKLFKHLRRLFGYVTQTVDADTRFGMGRTLDVDAEPDYVDDIRTIWERSNFQRQKYKLARFAANLGDSYLIVQDISDNSSVVVPRIVVANSEDMDVVTDPDDQTQVVRAKQSYSFIGDDGRPHRRDWIYYPDRIERYTDDKLDEGYPKPHPFREVPVIQMPFVDIGEAYGLCSWHSVQGQLDGINEMASFSNRIMLRYADPLTVASGVQPNEDASIRRGIKDHNIMYLANPEAKLGYLEFNGSVLSDILEMIRDVEKNIKDQLPELTLSQIREQTGLSGYSVSLQAAELIAKINEFRGNMSNGIEWANSLALRAIRRSNAPLEEFANRILYDPVLPEDPEQKQRIEHADLDKGLTSRRRILRERGLGEAEIDRLLQEVDDDRAADSYGIGRLLDEMERERQNTETGASEGNDEGEGDE